MKDDHKTKPSSRVLKGEDISFYYDKALGILSKYEHAKSAEWVKELVETCIAEREFDDGLTDFLEYIRSNGLEIETDQGSIEALMRKLFELRFTRKMIHAVGLNNYEERILNHLIDNKFSPGVPPLPTIKKK